MRYLAEGLFWEAAGTGLWLLTLSSVSTSELVTALLCALPCAVLAIAARRAVESSWAPRPRWIRWLLPLPAAVLADGARVLGLAALSLAGRPVPAGELRTVGLIRDRDDRAWRAHRAVAVTLVSPAPGTVALDVAPRSGELLVHALGSGRPEMQEVVRR